MQVRQVALVARDLDPVVADLCAVFGLEVGFRDPGVAEFGLRNAVLPIGRRFLEVVSPVRADATAARYLDRNGGDGGYMVLVQTADLAADRRRLAALGVRIVWQVTLDDIAAVHLHPRDVGGAIVSLDNRRRPCVAVGRPAWRRRHAGRHLRPRRRHDRSGGSSALSARWSAVPARPRHVVTASPRSTERDPFRAVDARRSRRRARLDAATRARARDGPHARAPDRCPGVRIGGIRSTSRDACAISVSPVCDTRATVTQCPFI
jgi:hypothetical protein